MEEMIYSFCEQYGWQLTLIACSGILVLGILKIPQLHLFDRISEGKRKYIYAVISAILSIATAAIYLVIIDKFQIAKFGVLSLGILGVNQAAYFVYENFGIRALIRKLGNIIKNGICKTIGNKRPAALPETNKEIEDVDIIDDLH